MKRIRILSYAINGRGMGHLVRQLAILRQVRRLGALLGVRVECWILTSSEADTLARREGFPAIKLPSKAMLRDGGLDPQRFLAAIRSTVLQAVSSLGPDLLIADTFPGGSVGELIPVLELVPHRVLVARKVREQVTADPGWQALLPLYDRIIQPDERGTGPILIRDRAELLSRNDARRALGCGDQRAVYLSLGGGGDLAAAGTLPRLTRQLRDCGWHVVVGAGPLYTGPELRGPGITWLSRTVPIELLPGVDAAVAAAGYNTFNELMYVGIPTVFLPQPRISDDQQGRAQRAVDCGAGRLAPSLDAVGELLEQAGDAAAARALVPRNGALDAAVAALSGLLPKEDLELASHALTPALLRGLRRICPPGRAPGDELGQALDLVRVLAGGSPSQQRSHAALLSELAGAIDPSDPSDPTGTTGTGQPTDAAGALASFISLCEDHDVPLDTALTLLRGLDRKFPAAQGPQLLVACQRLFPLWARFDDWMGAVSLLRAVPTQRTLSVAAFSTGLAAWLQDQDDLFDALRSFSRLEAHGKRPIAEVLALLCSGATS